MFIVFQNLNEYDIDLKRQYIVLDTEDFVFEILKGSQLIEYYKILSKDFYNIRFSNGRFYLYTSISKLYDLMLSKVSVIGDFKIYFIDNIMLISNNDNYILLRRSNKGVFINDFEFLNEKFTTDLWKVDKAFEIQDIIITNRTVYFSLVYSAVCKFKIKFADDKFYLEVSNKYVPIKSRNNFNKALLLESGG